MFARLSETFKKYATGKLVLAALALNFFFMLVVMPGIQRHMLALAPESQALDLFFFYTPAQIYHRLDIYGEAGRTFFSLSRLTYDMAFPIVYTLAYSLSITWLFRRGFGDESRAMRLNLVPLGGLLFDVLENLCFASMVAIFPAQPAGLAWVAASFTAIKWTFAGISGLLILVGIVAALLKRPR
jgi:hypothetical protein